MWKRNISILIISKRAVNSVRKFASRRSYIHKPGAEPLRYVTVGEILAETTDQWPDRLAVRSVHQEKSITYAELLTQADSLGCAVRALGLERGDRLGVWAHNCWEWAVTLAAATRVGIIPVAINPVYEKPELSFCMKKVGLKGLLIGESINDRNYGDIIKEMIPELAKAAAGQLQSAAFPDLKVVIACGNESMPGMHSFNSLIRSFEKESKNMVSKYSKEISPDDGCIIHFTSGTTGRPKAALDSHFGIVNNTFYIGKRNTLHEQHHKICVQVPIFHAFGTVITVFTAFRHGATLVLPSAMYNSGANADAIRAERCTVIHGTPTMFVDLISKIKSQGSPPSDVQVVLTAGAPCSPQLFRNIQDYIRPHSVKSLFGMTETTASVFQSLPGETMEQITETVGSVQDHIEVKIVNEDGITVPFGQVGELLVRGYNTMLGYWDEPEKTRQTLQEDGWLRTGDQFILQEDGYARIVGRLKDIIVRGGENIAPKEIEDTLDTHPAIVESQVIGVQDERLGEEICAIIRLQEGSTLSIQDVVKHCSGKLSKFKIPRLVKIIDEYPKTASGKIQKYKLKDLIVSGRL